MQCNGNLVSANWKGLKINRKTIKDFSNTTQLNPTSPVRQIWFFFLFSILNSIFLLCFCYVSAMSSCLEKEGKHDVIHFWIGIYPIYSLWLLYICLLWWRKYNPSIWRWRSRAVCYSTIEQSRTLFKFKI